MLILSRVCAEFHNTKGEPLFAVTPVTRNIFVEAPDAIREDPLFRMLVSDGSLEAAVSEDRKKVLENNPTVNTDAEGKSKTDTAITKAAAGKTAKAGKADGDQ